MALSITFFPNTLTTNAIWYGCDLSRHDVHGYDLTDAEIITSHLSTFDGGAFHPLLLPTIFSDFERDRQIGLVRDFLTESVQRVNNLAQQDTQSSKGSHADLLQIGEKTRRIQSRSSSFSSENLQNRLRRFFDLVVSGAQPDISGTTLIPSSPDSEKKQEPSVLLWSRISFLRNGLKNWQAQLYKMIEHVDELDATDFSIGPAAKNMSWQVRLASLRKSGDRIKARLQDIVNDYDEAIRDCTHIMDGMTLATQLVSDALHRAEWGLKDKQELNNIGRKDAMTNQEISRVNLDVAKMARRDGSLMRSIATLGMVFLPATFVSTFFSMGFFQWAAEGSKDGQILSPYFWVYIVVTVALTILTILIFYSCALRQPRSDTQNEKEIV
ncbi:hypothetical protein FALBO_10089 [Fusarium albosuccineum]|uniref:Uncharacterized protein n=1 Tax=Fusarium albosuccineum TaxID=1237068 RepID=A0A8H4PA43_9HYPO|nr:hypothetical protein FALBO_10089 [Fusarium albosuccineum]